MSAKTLRKILKPLLYMGVFWIFMDILPNTVFPGGPVSKIIAAFGFFLAYTLGSFLLSFFKLGRNVIAHFIVCAATTTGYLFLMDKYLPNILDLNSTYIGNTNFFVFKIPELLQITDIVSICIFCALILVFCCIIIEVSNKRN